MQNLTNKLNFEKSCLGKKMQIKKRGPQGARGTDTIQRQKNLLFRKIGRRSHWRVGKPLGWKGKKRRKRKKRKKKKKKKEKKEKKRGKKEGEERWGEQGGGKKKMREKGNYGRGRRVPFPLNFHIEFFLHGLPFVTLPRPQTPPRVKRVASHFDPIA